MNKNILGIAAILLAVQVFVGVSLAACDGCNRLDFYNQVSSSGGMVQVYQEGTGDVSFTNDIQVTNGGLDFTQIVNSGQWKLTNLAYLEGRKVTFQGVTIGAEECTDCDAGEIKFNQHIEVDGSWDPWAYQKLEQLCDGTVLEQKVDIAPGGWMNIDQSGWGCSYCGQGFLAQSGKVLAPQARIWQAGTVDGNTGYNEVYKAPAWPWLEFNQVVSFNID